MKAVAAIDELTYAVVSLPAPGKCDRYGVSVFMCKLSLQASPVLSLDFFNQLASSMPYLSEWVIDGHVFGKSAKVTAATETRAILPLPSALLIIDVALARRWNQWIKHAVPQDHGIHI